MSDEKSKCVVCGNSLVFRWSDYSGEAMCCHCGTPYQVKWGSDQQKEEGDYPYLNLAESWIPVVREYYEKTGRFVELGAKLGGTPEGMRDFYEWVDRYHPEVKKATA